MTTLSFPWVLIFEHQCLALSHVLVSDTLINIYALFLKVLTQDGIV